MKSYLKLVTALPMLAVLSSCYTPKAVIRVKPEETNTTWDKGKEYVSYKKGAYQVHSSFNGYNDRYLIFDVEIVNISGEDILVAPEEIKLYTGYWNNKSQQTEYSQAAINALDPELQLLNIDLAQSRAEANSKNSQVAATAFLVAAIPLSIAAAIADGNNSNYVEENVTNSELVDAGVNLAIGASAVNGAVQEGKIISLNDDKYTWQESALRKTTLTAGYSIRGLVYFPIPSLSVRKIRLDVPVGEDKISIDYNIILYYPNDYPQTNP